MPEPALDPLPANAAHRPRAVLWSVQYCRAAAALGVIAFHALANTGHDFAFGAVGIHLFFAISGFLMWTTTCGRPAGIGRFLRARIGRIVPMYWIATAATLALSVAYPGFFYQATLAPAHVAKSLLFVPQAGVDGGTFPVLYQGWTLQYEMFFYALFALALTRPVAQRLWWLGGAIGTLALTGIVHGPFASPIASTYTDPIMLEFLLGALAGWACTRDPIPPRFAAALLAIGLAGLLSAYPALATWRATSWLPVGGSAALILPGAVGLEHAGRMPRWRWLKYLGEASYSLYLCQEFGFLIADRIADAWPPASGVMAKAALGAMAAVAVGLVAYFAMERPLQALLRPAKPVV